MKKRTKTQNVALADTIDRTVKELRLAYARINGSSVARLRWLLNFSELKLDELSEGRFADLRWEVVVFGLNKAVGKLHNIKEIWDELTTLLLPPQDIAKGLKMSDEAALRLQLLQEGLTKGAHPEVVKGFQVFVRHAFDTLFSGEWWTYEGLPKTKAIAIPHLVGIEKSYAELSKPMRADQLLELRAFELIDAEKSRLTICENPKCLKRFISAKEGRTRFHNPSCSAYVRIAKSRGKEVYDKDIPPGGIQKYLSKKKQK